MNCPKCGEMLLGFGPEEMEFDSGCIFTTELVTCTKCDSHWYINTIFKPTKHEVVECEDYDELYGN